MSGLLLLCGVPRVSLKSVGVAVCPQLFYSTASKNKWLKRQQNDHFTREAKIQNLRSRAAFKLREIDDKYKLFTPGKLQNVLDLGFAPGSWSEVARQRTDPKSMILGVDILPCEPPTGVSSLQANILSQKTQELIRLYFGKHAKLDDMLTDPKNIHETHGYFKPSHEEIIDPEYEHELKAEEEYREVFTPDDKIPTAQQPIDIILSDMYVPTPRLTGFTNNITNMPYYRLMNTSGVAIRDHLLSVDLCDAALVTAIDLLKVNGSFVCKLYTGKEDNLFEKRMRKVFKTVQRFKPVSSRMESKEVYFVGLNKLANVDKFKVFT
ncbi:rRNA methyltransferase 2, mitochondrial [Monosporozyma unispora]|nr:2' O-ribose methyltransferase [Kazachstania unispora]